jgi:hypothetical protein
MRTAVHRSLSPLATCAGAALLGCGMPAQSTRIVEGPEPVEIRMRPAIQPTGQSAELVIKSPGADSIALESINGVDRYWSAGPRLRVLLGAEFGDASAGMRYAERRDGRLLSLLKKPVRISSCRLGSCRDVYHEIPVRLPERNERTIAITAGYSTVFARRTLVGGGRTVLFKEAPSSGVWSVQGEWAAHGWNAQFQGFSSADERGGSLDLSRVLKRSSGISYGIAMHLGGIHSEWLPDDRSPVIGDRTAYSVSIGPSVMLKGITASSQIGLDTDGSETLQIMSTRVSVNGNLTSVRHPILVTAEKTIAFGGGPIVSRRRDTRERLTAGVYLFHDFAARVGISSHRIAWPHEHPADDLRASEVLITLGGQYSLTW